MRPPAGSPGGLTPALVEQAQATVGRGVTVPRPSFFQDLTMTLHRLLPPADGRAQSVWIDGKLYSSKAGRFVDAPATDALELVAAGWGFVGPVGGTGDRPAATEATPGLAFLDTDHGGVVVWDGRTWRDPMTGETV